MNNFHFTVVNVLIGQPLNSLTIRQLDFEGNELISEFVEETSNLKLSLVSGTSKLAFSAKDFCEKSYSLDQFSRSQLNYVKLIPSSPIGYLGKLYAFPGDQLSLHVHSLSEWGYTLYKHGLKRKVILKKIGFACTKRVVPDSAFVAEGLNWESNTTIDLPMELHSGLYSLTIEDSDGRRFTMPLAIGPNSQCDGATPQFLVLGNTNTWQAYNVWGGKSRYRNFDIDPVSGGIESHGRFTFSRILQGLIRRLLNLWRKISGGPPVSGIRLEPSWISDRLSPLRPIPNPWLDIDSPYSPYVDHLAANEWRALAWMEREGFSYDYCSDEMLHQNSINLNDYHGIVLVGHAEYWSTKMFEHLHDSVVKNGVALINLSGNSIYQEVQFDNEGGIFPMRGEFRETSYDPALLIGTRTDLSVQGFAPFLLKDAAMEHWTMAGINLDSLNQNKRVSVGLNSLIDLRLLPSKDRYDPFSPGIMRGEAAGVGASGWEVDKFVGLPSRRPIFLAKGLNSNEGADMFIIEDETGVMFSAASISFVSSLLVDSEISQILNNVLTHIVSKRVTCS